MGVILIEERVQIPQRIGTLEQFRTWSHSDEFPREGRIDFIAGDIEVSLLPQRYQSVSGLLVALIHTLETLNKVGGLGKWFVQDVRLTSKSAELSTMPDLMFVSNDAWKAGRVAVMDAPTYHQDLEIEGSPNIVVEIVSDSSEEKDNERLPQRYFLAGVQEYWRIDARKEPLQFNIFDSAASSWKAVDADTDGFRPSMVLQHWFKLVRVRSLHGYWSYELLNRD